MEHARTHVGFLAETVGKDVAEIRRGLPEGGAVISAKWLAEPDLAADPKALQRALDDGRRKVQDLRVAKSTFFALADPTGAVLRNDQEQDRMVGKALFAAYPGLEKAAVGYVETSGTLLEAAGVRAPRPDGQWVAGVPVVVGGATTALYVTGFSWSAYAYRLEFGLRARIKSELNARDAENEPLVYAFVIVGKVVYGAPVSPEVSREEVSKLDPLSRIQGDAVFAERMEITGRSYGVAARRTPDLGADVGVAVLRSET